MLSLTSRTRYGLLALIDLAEHGVDGFIKSRDVASRKEIPPKFLGQIFPSLVQAGLVVAQRGARGGYKLALSPHLLTIDRALLALGATGPSTHCLYGVERSTCTLPARNDKCDGIGPVQETAMRMLSRITLAEMCPGYAPTAANYDI